MRSYLEKVLGQRESIVAIGYIAWPYRLGAWASLLFLGVFIIGVVIFIRMMVWIHTTEFAVTNRKVVFKTGLFTRESFEIPLTSVDEVELEQGFWGRLFNFGRLHVWGSGRGEMISPPIANPVKLRSALSDARARIIQPAGEQPDPLPEEAARTDGKPARSFALDNHMPAHVNEWN